LPGDFSQASTLAAIVCCIGVDPGPWFTSSSSQEVFEIDQANTQEMLERALSKPLTLRVPDEGIDRKHHKVVKSLWGCRMIRPDRCRQNFKHLPPFLKLRKSLCSKSHVSALGTAIRIFNL